MDLSNLPKDQVPGLDRNQVENDRKKYWDQFFEKYEELGAECTSTVGLEDIDKPDLVAEGLRGVKRRNLEFPVSKTLRTWVEQHEDEIDELTTIAGPPSVDEEEISQEEYESDSDDLADLIDDRENIPPDVEGYLPSSPPSSPQHSPVDLSDSDSERLLYTPNLPSTTCSIFAPLSISENLNYKDKLIFSPQLSSSRNNSFALSEALPTNNLNCSACHTETNYSTRLGLDESEFKCDSCMMDDSHPDCHDDCDNCKKIAAQLEARWIHRENMEGEKEVIRIGEEHEEKGLKDSKDIDEDAKHQEKEKNVLKKEDKDERVLLGDEKKPVLK